MGWLCHEDRDGSYHLIRPDFTFWYIYIVRMYMQYIYIIVYNIFIYLFIFPHNIFIIQYIYIYSHAMQYIYIQLFTCNTIYNIYIYIICVQYTIYIYVCMYVGVHIVGRWEWTYTSSSCADRALKAAQDYDGSLQRSNSALASLRYCRGFQTIWANYSDLTVTSLESWLDSKGNYPTIALFQVSELL